MRRGDGGPVDLVVLGGGAAGLVAARTAAGLGASVTLVDRDAPGGDCLWTGCVPSKALLAAARRAHDVRDAGRFGVVAGAPAVDFPAVMATVRAAVAALEPPDSPAALAAAGVRVLRGSARFTGPDRLEVDGAPLGFRRALVATGARPVVPDVPGLDDVRGPGADGPVLTTDTVWDLTALPASLLVVGAGPVGCELGQAFARLGARVVLVDPAEHPLPAESAAAGEALRAALEADGVDVRTSTALRAVYPDPDAGGGVRVTLGGPDGEATLPVARVLLAVGRRPDTAALDPAAAGIDVGQRGEVLVDDRLRSSHPRVLAAGDVTGGLAFTHLAGVAGSVAATNAVLGPLRRLDTAAVPRVTFTSPEVARVGATLEQARATHGAGARVHRRAHAHLDRAVVEQDTGGFTDVVLDRRGRVLGACVVAPRAGEMLAELTALVARGGRLRDLASVTHPYPGWTDATWNAAVAEVSAATRRPVARAVLRGAVTLRRVLTRAPGPR